MPCQSFGSTGLAQKNSEALPRKLLCGLRLYLCVRPIFGYGLNPVLPAVWGDGVDFHSRSMTPATHGSNCHNASWVSSPSREKLSEQNVGRIARGLRRGDCHAHRTDPLIEIEGQERAAYSLLLDLLLDFSGCFPDAR